MHSDGGVVNPTQKPSYIASELAKAFLAPGSTVVVVGAGAGGSVEGFISAGMNVVAFENDIRQVEALRQIWTGYESAHAEKGDKCFKQKQSGILGHCPTGDGLSGVMIKGYLKSLRDDEIGDTSVQAQQEIDMEEAGFECDTMWPSRRFHR